MRWSVPCDCGLQLRTRIACAAVLDKQLQQLSAAAPSITVHTSVATLLPSADTIAFPVAALLSWKQLPRTEVRRDAV